MSSAPSSQKARVRDPHRSDVAASPIKGVLDFITTLVRGRRSEGASDLEDFDEFLECSNVLSIPGVERQLR
jgi:hypothetical protein